MKELLPYLLLTFACLAALALQAILLTKVFKKEKAEMKKNYAETIDKLKKDFEFKLSFLKTEKPMEIKQTLVPTKEYAKTIIVDRNDINLLNDKKELMEMLRSGFADQFAKEVIKPNLNIHEIVDMDVDLSGKKKYMAKMWMGF